MSDTKIAWTQKTWNPVTGCTPASPACDNCYARAMAKRLKAMEQERYRDGFDVTLHPEALTEPLKWRKPRMIFVVSMGDLFHAAVPFDYIDKVFAVMALCPQHTFQVLTKRPERMASVLPELPCLSGRVLPNVWIGTTVENQTAADERMWHLRQCPATVRFLSLEPLLEHVDYLGPLAGIPVGECAREIQWVIVGCESGPRRRPCKLEWVRSIVEQCQAASVAVFVKQLDINGRVSHDPTEWPEDLRVRQFPGHREP